MSFTLTQIRNRVQDEMKLGITIENANIDNFTGGVTSARYLRNSRHGASHYSSQNTVIFRPTTATTADRIRWAGDLTNSSGLLAHTGAAYTDTTVGTETCELWYYGVDPDYDFLKALNRAMETVFFTTYIMIGHLSLDDGDMRKTATTSWTAIGATLSKVTTAADVPWGQRALRAVNASGEDGARSVSQTIQTNGAFSMHAIASAAVSSGILVAYDVTNSAEISSGHRIVSAEAEPMLLRRVGEVAPSTCKSMQVRLLGTSATADVYWNGAQLYKHDNLKVNLPASVFDYFQIPEIYQFRPRSGSTTNNVLNAQSCEFIRLVKGVDYEHEDNKNDANPQAVIFRDSSYYQWPLFALARFPYSDLTTFDTTESTTTNAPLQQLVPAVKMQLMDGKLLQEDQKRWQPMYAKAYEEWKEANSIRQDAKPGMRRRVAVNTIRG